jgi:hypothetical protein
MAEGDPRVGQVVLGGVVVGRGQQTSRQGNAGKRGQAETGIDGQLDFTLDR